MSSDKRKEMLRRHLVALLSLVFLALGVTLMTRSQLEISPIQSVAYVVYNRLAEHTTLGTVVLCWNCVQVFAQWPLLGRRFGWKQLIQVPLSFLFFGTWRFDIVGAGTLISATLAGVGVRLFNPWIRPAVERFCTGKEKSGKTGRIL